MDDIGKGCGDDDPLDLVVFQNLLKRSGLPRLRIRATDFLKTFFVEVTEVQELTMGEAMKRTDKIFSPSPHTDTGQVHHYSFSGKWRPL